MSIQQQMSNLSKQMNEPTFSEQFDSLCAASEPPVPGRRLWERERRELVADLGLMELTDQTIVRE